MFIKLGAETFWNFSQHGSHPRSSRRPAFSFSRVGLARSPEEDSQHRLPFLHSSLARVPCSEIPGSRPGPEALCSSWIVSPHFGHHLWVFTQHICFWSDLLQVIHVTDSPLSFPQLCAQQVRSHAQSQGSCQVHSFSYIGNVSYRPNTTPWRALHGRVCLTGFSTNQEGESCVFFFFSPKQAQEYCLITD